MTTKKKTYCGIIGGGKLPAETPGGAGAPPGRCGIFGACCIGVGDGPGRPPGGAGTGRERPPPGGAGGGRLPAGGAAGPF